MYLYTTLQVSLGISTLHCRYIYVSQHYTAGISRYLYTTLQVYLCISTLHCTASICTYFLASNFLAGDFCQLKGKPPMFRPPL